MAAAAASAAGFFAALGWLARERNRPLGDMGTSTPRCTVHCDHALALTQASPALRTMLGLSEVPARGTSFATWLAPGAALPLADAIGRSRAGGGAGVSLRLRMRHADNGWRDVDTRVRAVGARAVLECAVVGRRVRAPAPDALTADDLDLALDGARCALWDADLDTGTMRLSPQWSRLLGAVAGQTVTTMHELAQRVHSEDLQDVRSAWRRVLKGEDPQCRVEHRVRCDDGRWLWIESLGRVVERAADGRVLRMSGVAIDASERRQAQAQLADLALHDPLTDLPNRALLTDRITQSIAQAARHGETMAVLVLDIDRFGHFNALYGHAACDALLCEIADRLRQVLCHGETLARVGGDKFAVALPAATAPERAAGVAQQLIDALAAPIRVAGEAPAVSACVGIAMCPVDGQEVATLLRSADIALAQAKAVGPGQMQFCDPQVSARARRRLLIERELAGAAARGELWIAYQPVFEVASQRIVGAEALLRWTHPQLGAIEPGEFIPIAEACGLINPLGRWTLDWACTQARAWQAALAPDFRLAVNLSPLQLRDPGLVDAVCAALQRTSLAPGSLVLEVTESVFVGDEPQALDTLRRLKREAAAQLAIDDFGCGYSTFGSLRHLPVDRLKIDRSFVRDIPANAADAAIVRAIVSVAGALGLDVTAEGVETAEQLECLAAMGCAHAQGHGLARPMNADALTARLEHVVPRAA
ncbi:MAG TPA: EAL domain-containing protein [Burkholderiaceae bacterium]|nr:EAL domain-containing protein [Burkholderiaceae bacterium]